MMNSKALKKQLAAAIAMVVVAGVALSSSTYAWFVSNTKVTASQVNVTASTTYALMISQDDASNKDVWTTACTLTNNTSNDKYDVYLKKANTSVAVYKSKADNKFYTTADLTTEVTPAVVESEYQLSASATLKPVSTIGFANDSDSDAMAFYQVNAWTNDNAAGNAGNHASGFTTAPATDYFKTTFKIKASQICDLRLDSENTTFTATQGEMPRVMRMALVVKGSNNKYNTFMYQIDKSDGTNTYNTTLSTLTGAVDSKVLGVKEAISGAGEASSIVAHNLVSGAVPAYNDTDVMVVGNSTDLVAAATTDAQKAQILYTFGSANDICEVTMYLWMEGCDAECNADNINQFNGAANQLVAKLGFCAATKAE